MRARKSERLKGSGAAASETRFLTTEQLAEVLQVCTRTVERMVALEEIPVVRLCEGVLRFYLPDVVRRLTATALTRKRGRGMNVEGEGMGTNYPRRAE